jgi:hypothetical protein
MLLLLYRVWLPGLRLRLAIAFALFVWTEVENILISLFARSSRLEELSIRHLYLALHSKMAELSDLIG